MAQPSRIGRYQIERILGSGTFATVCEAFDERLEDRVAIKILEGNWARRPDIYRRFVEEARLLRRISDDRVVRVFDIADDDEGRPYIVMTLADRGTLHERVRERKVQGRPFSVDEALAIASAIADSLGVVHDEGVVHRDLKPSNVLFRSLRRRQQNATGRYVLAGEQLLLGDFGLAKDVEKDAGGSVIAGTPAYMAPEQAVFGILDRRADVFALAAITYELLAGRAAFATSTISGVGRAQQGSGPPPVATIRPDLPSAVDDVLAKGLARERDERFASAAEFVEALVAVIGRPEGSAADLGRSRRNDAVDAMTAVVDLLEPAVTSSEARQLWLRARDRLVDQPKVAVVDDGSGLGLDLAWRFAGERLADFALDRRFHAPVVFRAGDPEMAEIATDAGARRVALARGADGRLRLDVGPDPSSTRIVRLRLHRPRLRTRTVVAVPFDPRFEREEALVHAAGADVVVVVLPDDVDAGVRLGETVRRACAASDVAPVAVLGACRHSDAARRYAEDGRVSGPLAEVGAVPAEGLGPLAETADAVLVRHGDVTRATAALALVERILALPETAAHRALTLELADRIEQLRLEVPLLQDYQVLRADSAGKVVLAGPLRAELRRVLLATDASRRLGLPPGSRPEEQLAAAESALRRWRGFINTGRVPFGSREAAHTVARALDRLWSWASTHSQPET